MIKVISENLNKDMISNRVIKLDEKHLEQNGIFIGDREILLESIKDYYDKKNIKINLFLVNRFEISVDDVRELINWAKVSSENKKVAIFSSFYFNVSMQNAMLKVLEEAGDNLKIFLIAKSKNFFIPTILSRVYVQDYSESTLDFDLVNDLLSLPIHLRLQNNKLKKILLAKVENIDVFKSNTKIDDSKEEGVDSVEGEAEEDAVEEGAAASKGRKDREKHVELFEQLFHIIKKDFQAKINEDIKSVSKVELEYMKNLNTLAANIYEYGSNPQLSLEYILLTYQK